MSVIAVGALRPYGENSIVHWLQNQLNAKKSYFRLRLAEWFYQLSSCHGRQQSKGGTRSVRFRLLNSLTESCFGLVASFRLLDIASISTNRCLLHNSNWEENSGSWKNEFTNKWSSASYKSWEKRTMHAHSYVSYGTIANVSALQARWELLKISRRAPIWETLDKRIQRALARNFRRRQASPIHWCTTSLQAPLTWSCNCYG